MRNEGEMVIGSLAAAREKALDFAELMKPELTGLSVLTALTGFYLGSPEGVDLWKFFVTAVGTLLVGGGAGALNQLMERRYDALMKRTERRPLPAGRLSPRIGLLYGLGLSVAGVVLLASLTNTLTGALALMTLLIYVLVYTPLKRVTHVSTLIGGVPGALPPVMGWTAASGGVNVGALVLFAVLFCWQMPHFYSLAWMYRKDYARARYRMLSVLDQTGVRTSGQSVLYCVLLIPASSALTTAGVTGTTYLVVASVLGIAFLWFALAFARASGNYGESANASANLSSRKLFFASLVYLPVLMFAMLIDKA